MLNIYTSNTYVIWNFLFFHIIYSLYVPVGIPSLNGHLELLFQTS